MKRFGFALATIAVLTLPLAAAGDKDYKTWWTKANQAKKKAETSRFGILYYFPPKGSKEVHSIFKGKEMETQSLASPMVKVADEKLHLLRETYKPNDKLHTVIVTDWYGNVISKKPFQARTVKQKLDVKGIVSQIKGAINFADKTEAALAKKLAKGEKAFAKKRWSSAIKEYLAIVEFQGYEPCVKAKDRLDEIVEEGRAELESAGKLEGDDKKKKLKKIAKDFKGTEVQKEAEEALAELDGR